MTGNDLYEPLKGRADRRGWRPPLGPIMAGLAVVAVGSAAAVILRGNGGGGEPFAVATIERPKAGAVSPVAASQPPSVAAPVIAFAPPSDRAAADVPGQAIDIQNGISVIRPVATGGSGPVMIKVPEHQPEPADPALAKAPDSRLIESGSDGPLPKVGRDGSRPDHIYAHRAVLAGQEPRIAIVIGGMGLDRQATAEAPPRLPSATTLAFAPYGDDLADQVRKARQAGHEVILQLPMEGFGPAEGRLSHMLLAEGRNDDRLHWLMSRFTGYVGLGNYLGGRLLSDEGALRPILREIAARGLFFFDDGTAPQSLAASLAPELGIAVVRADVVLDAKPDGAAMAAAFARLEALARQRGLAVGTVTGRSETVDLVAAFLTESARHGVTLVPLSQAALLDTTSSVASQGPGAPR